MMQGRHNWFKTLSQVYRELGYKQSRAEPTIRTRCTLEEAFTITYMYTDDTMGDSSNTTEEEKAKRELGEHFEAKMIPEVSHMLGIKVERMEKGIRVSQKAYTIRVLEKFGMMNCKPRSILLPPSSGYLMWLQVGTRPDLSFVVNSVDSYINYCNGADRNAQSGIEQ